MKRALVFVLALTACVDLKKGRPWRCERPDDCTSGWACLKDGYCHDPNVGAAVPCETRADCPGAWLCGQAGQCLDPGAPAAFPCANDEQCAGGWRCAARGVCVDFEREPQPLAPSDEVGEPALRSPLGGPGALLRVSPTVRIGAPGLRALVAARVHDAGVELLMLARSATPNGLASAFSTSQVEVSPGFVPRDLAVTAGLLLLQRPDGTLTRVLSDGGLGEVPLAEVPTRLVPLSWEDALEQRGAAVLAVGATESWLVFPDGVTSSVGRGVVDAAAELQPDGGLGLLLLRPAESDYLTLMPSVGAKAEVVLSTDGGVLLDTPTALRRENDGLAVLYTLGGIVSGSGARLVCRGCDEPLGPMLQCPSLRYATDFGVTTPLTAAAPALLCGADDSHHLYAGTDQLLDVRAGHVAGTSGGHVRQLAGGQVLFGQSLLDEAASVLADVPRGVGFVNGKLAAVRGRDLYLEGAGGLALALQAEDPDAIVTSFVEGGAEMLLFAQGFTLRDDPQRGEVAEFFVRAPDRLQEARAQLLHLQDGGTLFVATEGDTLYAAAGDPEDTAVAEPRLKPTAGFAVTDWAVREADAGLVEGWAVANNRLFRLTASTAERWRSTEATPQGRDPLGVWFSGPSALLGTVEGEVLALPSGVPVSAPLGPDVTSVHGRCGATFATTSSGVFQLAAGDGGLAGWVPLPTRELDGPVLYEAGGRVFVADATGVVLELPLRCP